MQRIFSPFIALLNRISFTRKFTLLWLGSFVAIAVVSYSLFVSLGQVIRPSQRELQGLPLIEPISRSIQYLQQHRGLSAALLGGNANMRDRLVSVESQVIISFQVMEEMLPPSLIATENYQHIKAGWERLLKQGLNWTSAESFDAHTQLIEQAQLFVTLVADEYNLTLDQEVASYYLINSIVFRLPHVLEHLGQLRAYGTSVLAEKQLTEIRKAQFNVMRGQFENALNQLKLSLDKAIHSNPLLQQSIQVAYADIVSASRRITDLVESDILTGQLKTSPDVFMDLATEEINNGYSELHQALLPIARNLIETRIDRAERTLSLTIAIALVLFLIVGYIKFSIYYAIAGSIQSLVRAAHNFANGDLSQRIKLDSHDELSQIGDSFNKMADAFNTMLDSRKQVEQKFQSLVESSSDWIWEVDVNGVYTYASPKLKDLLGYEPEEVIGKTPFDFMLPEEKVRVGILFEKIGREKKPFSGLENSCRHKDGQIVFLETNGVPVFDKNDEFCGYRGIDRDITQRKQAEEKLKKLNATLEARVEERTHELKLAKDQADAASQAKSNFLSNMSHEIRSPLAAVIGFSESLITDNYNEQERKKIISTIVRNGRYLQQVINDILDLSKIEAEQLEIELTNTSIFLLLEEIELLMGMKARDKGLEFNITYHFPLPEQIVTDSMCLKQILVNLCSNAIKFTDEGRIEIEVGCDKNSRQIEFIVSDTGIGMTPEEKTRVFAPFSQADSTITRRFGGTGLGLSISDKLAKALDGQLTCESSKGEGSRFILTITNQDTDQSKLINSLEQVSFSCTDKYSQADIKPLAGSILLVEDNPDIQQLVSMYIRKTGAQLTVANNGMQAIEMAQAQEFDLILMDMQMPVMDGLEAIRQLRTKGYRHPIVSLTANSMLSDREQCEAAGADAYLAKPVDPQKFYRVLNRYLAENTAVNNADNSRELQDAMLNSPQYKAIVDRFLHRLPQILDEISTACAGKNWDELQAKSHDLKGMGGALGYPEITEIAARVNSLVKQKNYDELENPCAELEAVCCGILHKSKLLN